jgi:hypothetical protein
MGLTRKDAVSVTAIRVSGLPVLAVSWSKAVETQFGVATFTNTLLTAIGQCPRAAW